MKQVFKRPDSLKDVPFRFCPGCSHGTLHRMVAQAIDELGVREKTIGIAPVGCAVFAYDYFNFDVLEVAHGRPPAACTGMKRAMPDRLIFSYQGDGDLAAIGMSEIIHAANRGENFTVIFVNNATYGMTGGQMAPTTLVGQKTTTTPGGRAVHGEGYPIRVSEMLATLETPYYIERTAMDCAKNVIKTRNAIKKAFTYQMDGRGFTFVEVLSICPVNWGMTPLEAMDWCGGPMKEYFPVGVFKDEGKRVV
ncbi:MAG: 2-oxoglutarate oxidoreductase [Nitrospirae bacterium]|nr:2-oxoglutarate oxidoreductase [Nitrospirota bacterium]